MSDEEFNEETWTYIGRRTRYGSDKLCYCYLDEQGLERSFAKGKIGVIGGRYKALVKHDGDRVLVRGTFKYVDDGDRSENDPVILEWLTQDNAAYDLDYARRAEQRDIKKMRALGNLTLDELSQAMRKLSGDERRAMLLRVFEYLMRY